MQPKILISSCLIGLNVRYDAKSNKVESLVKLVKEGRAIFLCPEQLGGLSTPRIPAEIEFTKTASDVLNGTAKIIGRDGSDLTNEFIKGAEATLKVCQELGITIAILKERSPSCGSNMVYDGTFMGNKISGQGLTTELLRRNGIKVYSEENFPNDL